MVGFIILGWLVDRIHKKYEKNLNEDAFVVRRPIYSLWYSLLAAFVPVVCLIWTIFAFFGIIENHHTGDWLSSSVAILIFSAASFGGTYFILVDCLRWKVEVRGQEIFYRYLKGSKVFAFDAITKAIKNEKNDLVLFSESKGLLSINQMSRGYNMFVTRLEQAGIQVILNVKSDTQ